LFFPFFGFSCLYIIFFLHSTLFLSLYFLRWSGIEFHITEATTWPSDDNDCSWVWNKWWNIWQGKPTYSESLPHYRLVHHKPYMTIPGLAPRTPRREASDQPPKLRHGLTIPINLFISSFFS
jgi:hypothetical protein